MSSNYHSRVFPFPVELHDEDQHHQLFSLKPQVSSSSSSLSCPIFFNPDKEQGGYYNNRESQQQFQHQEEVDHIFVSHGGSCDPPTPKHESDDGLNLTIWNKEERNEIHSENSSSVRWMSSKMRLMKKMMNSDPTGVDIPRNSLQQSEDQGQKKPSSPNLEIDNSNTSYNHSNITIRVCADCNTTKTPLWRSGPRGPKSLCNACGIRQRKARRAMAAAAAAASDTILAADHTPSLNKGKVQCKNKKTSNGCVSQFKKRCKLTSSQPRGRKKLCFEDLTIILSKNSAFQRVFPQDEKEAAILLMALSYGLVHG